MDSKPLQPLSAVRANGVRDAVDRLLASDIFDAGIVAWLSHRDRFADAADVMVSKARAQWTDSKRALPVLLETGVTAHVRLFRLAVAYGALELNGKFHLATVSVLHALSHGHSKKADGARLALAASGELADWRAASPGERAAFALGNLVRAFRDGVS